MRECQEVSGQVNEMELYDIWLFLRANWIVILLCGVVGAACAWQYQRTRPITYAATTLVSMARAPSLHTAVQADYVENANVLAERLASPLTYGPGELKMCAVASSQELAASVAAGVPPNLGQVIRLTVTSRSAQGAQRCALAVFDMIRTQQAALAQPAYERLRQMPQGLLNASSSTPKNVSDDVRMQWALDQIKAVPLIDAQARILTPITTSQLGSSSGRNNALLFGLMAGLAGGGGLSVLWRCQAARGRRPARS